MKMQIAERVARITPSPTLAVDSRAKEMISQGIDVVGFGAGEPDFPTPAHVKAAAVNAIEADFTRYTPAAGIMELRQAICQKLRRENGLEYEPAQVVVSVGGKHSLYNVFMALCQPGDEVLLPAPYWVSYPEQIRLAGGQVVPVEASINNEFKVTVADLEKHTTDRTRILVLNSPSNPTGAVYSRRELEALAEFLVARSIIVISDEVYEKLIYGDAEHVSIASLGEEIKDLTVLVNAVSKTYAMTGWRIGYAAAPREVAAAMAKLQGHVTSNPTSIAQKAALEALRGPQDDLEVMVAEYRRRRDYMVERLNAMAGVVCPQPEGAFYVFPSVEGLFGRQLGDTTINNADDLAAALLETARVALVPGTGFGFPGNVRLSYATSMERIEEGLNRMAAALAGIK